MSKKKTYSTIPIAIGMSAVLRIDPSQDLLFPVPESEVQMLGIDEKTPVRGGIYMDRQMAEKAEMFMWLGWAIHDSHKKGLLDMEPILQKAIEERRVVIRRAREYLKNRRK